MPSKDDLDIIDCSVMDSLNFSARHHHSAMPAWDNSSLSSCATTVIGDDRIVDVSSCSISIVSSSSRMSQTGGSRSPSEINHKTDEKERLKVEEKLKLCRERQEEERQRRLQEIEVSSQQRQKYREQLEEEKRRKIDELKAKEFEKRSAVEERKRLFWKADQERKEAILRRNNEIHEKLDAKRLALRNNTSFVFGSSTPRTMNLDVAVLGTTSRHNNPLIISSSVSHNNKTIADELSQDIFRRRPISAYFSDEHISTVNTKASIDLPENPGKVNRSNYNSDQTRIVCSAINNNNSVQQKCKPLLNGAIDSVIDDKLMSQSLVCLTGISRGRKRHTELRAVMPRERALASSSTRINKNNANSDTKEKQHTKRAVSMSRLDQLSKPRRIYLEESLKAQNSCNTGKQQSTADKNSKAKSMCNLANNHKTKKTTSSAIQQQNAASIRNHTFTTKSMTKLNSDDEKSKPSVNLGISHRSKSANKSSKSDCDFRATNTIREKSQSMIQLSSKPVLSSKPRQTRASKLRVQSSTLRNSKSSAALNDSTLKENKLSITPIRPLSSLNLYSNQKDNESDKQKAKPNPKRKPRPLSIGTTFRIKKNLDPNEITRNRESCSTERTSHSSQTNSTLLSSRTRSAGESLNKLSNDKTSKTLLSKSKSTKCVNKNLIEGKNKSDIQVVPIVEPKPMERHISVSLDNFNNTANFSPKKQQISEIEYKKMMIEKRKQVKKQQIERNAEIERKRLETEKLEELERQKTKDDEKKRLENERLERIESERLEEKKRVDDAKNKQRKEELKEKEEKERKAKQDSEHKRLELEERLKKDEEERLARKKKLEAIMSRTRKTGNTKKSDQQSKDHNGIEKTREDANNYQNKLKNEQLVIISNNDIKPDIVEDVNRAHRQLNAKENSDSLTYHNNSTDGSIETSNLINYYQFSSTSIDTPDQSIDNSYQQLIELNYNSPHNDQDINSKQCSPIIIATALKNSLKMDEKTALINGIKPN